jgi:hypothetical protein
VVVEVGSGVRQRRALSPHVGGGLMGVTVERVRILG